MTPILSPLQHPLAQTLGWTLLHFLWQGTALGLLAWLALALLRCGSAKARYGMACAFLVLMVLTPILTYGTLRPQGVSPAATLALSVEAAGSPTAAHATGDLVQRLKGSLNPALPWLLAGWVAGVLLLSTRFLGSWVRVQRLRRRSATPVPSEWHLVLSRLCRELKLSRTVRLLQSAAVEVPTALGWLRPVILLPACALAGLTPLQLEAILAHELAHIRRGDFLVNLLQSLVEVLLFYHPAIWWLSGRIRAERELCCDDVAAELCGDPLILARALTDLEALREPHTPSPTHLALAATGGSLMHRVRHLLSPTLPITSGARVTALAVLAASLLGAAGVALQDKAKADSDKTMRIAIADDQRKLDVTMKGEVKLNGEAPEPVAIPGDGSFRAEEKKGGKTRLYAATKAKATYSVDGLEKPLDKEGRDWLREVLRQVKRNQVGRKQERMMDVRLRRMDAQERELDAHGRALETQVAELERLAQSGKPEDQARLKAEGERLKLEGEKLKAEGARLKAEGERLKHDPELKVLIAQAEQEARRVRIEVTRQPGTSGAVTVDAKGHPKNVVVKRYKITKDGEPGEEQEVTLVEPELDEAMAIEIEKNIHIPNIHVQAFAHLDDDEDPKAEEIAEIQAELQALHARLDQLQGLKATPKAPRTPRTPGSPKAAHPPVPPPPPAPPTDLPTPPAPPAPPTPPPPAPPAPTGR